MAKESGLSKSTVGRIWKAFGLKPHLVETFKFSAPIPQFDRQGPSTSSGLYLDPPEKALVLCVDEKSQIQALDRTAPVLPMLPGLPETTHPRLPAPRHHHLVRRAGRGRPARSPDPCHRRHRAAGVPEVPQHVDQQIPADLRCAPDLRQLRHPRVS